MKEYHVDDDGWRIPDALWEKIAPLLPPPPPHPLGCHRPRVPNRAAMEAIFFVLRTGCQWNALSATGICSSSAAHRRFQEWEAAGVFAELWRQGLLEYDQERGIEWRWQALDGAMGKAPLGGEKNRSQSDRPEQDRHKTLRLDRWAGGTRRCRGRRSQRQRLQADGGHPGQHARRAA